MAFSLFSPTRTKIAANTLSQVLGKIISAAATIAISFIVAQKLGAAGYGDFAKITTYVAFFFLLSDFGINAIYLQRKDKELFSTLIVTRILWSLLLTFVAVAILAFLPQGTTQGFTPLVRLGIVLFAPAIFFQALITTANAVFQKHLRYDLATLALLVGSLISVGLLALTLLSSPLASPLVPILCLLVGIIVSALIAMALARIFTKSEPLHLRVSPALSLFVASVPFGLTLLFNVVYTRADTMLLTFFRSTAEVGIYALAYKVFEVFLVIPTFFMNALYPILLQATGNKGQGNNDQAFKAIIHKSAILLSLVACLLSLTLWFAAPMVTQINPDFVASIAVTRILALSLPFFFLTSITMWSLVALKRQGNLFLIYSVSMLANVAANVILIPQYGYMASAWITVASEGIVLVLSAIVLFYALNPKPRTP